jgi:lipoate-protein ligase A
MRLLDLTLPTPEENLALDEALLDEAEASAEPRETLRLWEPERTLVVIGRSSRIESEVRRDRCDELGVPVLRRTSGGAAIVAGPGCLMYALVLSYALRPTLRAIDAAHRFVLKTMAEALGRLTPGVQRQGTSDLAIDGRKFSGNSVRCKRDHLLYHGTLLYDFPLHQIARLLAMPPRQPDYRQGRGHEAFVTNLPVKRSALCEALITAWEATEPCSSWPQLATARLVAERYGQDEWNESLTARP